MIQARYECLAKQTSHGCHNEKNVKDGKNESREGKKYNSYGNGTVFGQNK